MRADDPLIAVGERMDEGRAVLEAAGRGLASLLGAGVAVSEWDLRNLTPVAAEAFFE
ncbi:MAG: hypothetical protein ACREN2_09895 [Candidatus Dormibacteria bacterium]